MYQYVLNLVGLLYPDRDSDAIHAWFDENFLVLVPGHCQRV